MRRLRRAPERRAGQQLPYARGARGRRDRHHYRRRGQRRIAPRRPGRVPRLRRRAVRHLHARHGAGRDRPAGESPERRRGGRTRGPGRQPVSLHGVHADLRIGARSVPPAARPAGDAMSGTLARYALERPGSLEDALAILAEDNTARPFAGGTDLMVLLGAGHLPPGRFVNLWGLRGLRAIEVLPDALAIGALTTYTDIRRSDVVARDYPMLVQAAAETGGVATQNRGTIGGNIANASPAADTPPALLAYDAALELRCLRGTRRLPYREFHTGYKQIRLEPGEII